MSNLIYILTKVHSINLKLYLLVISVINGYINLYDFSFSLYKNKGINNYNERAKYS